MRRELTHTSQAFIQRPHRGLHRSVSLHRHELWITAALHTLQCPSSNHISSLLNLPMGYNHLRRFLFLAVQHEPCDTTRWLQKGWVWHKVMTETENLLSQQLREGITKEQQLSTRHPIHHRAFVYYNECSIKEQRPRKCCQAFVIISSHKGVISVIFMSLSLSFPFTERSIL